MKRAFWFDGEYMDQQIATVDTTESHAVHFAKNYNNKSITENGATGYRTTTKSLLDLNFKVSSLRARDLILEMAKCNDVPEEELPKQVLIISDMEFDAATSSGYYCRENWKAANDTLFRQIAKKYEATGYKMPRLIFWNVCGRTDTIPMVNNKEGLCLLSGFSQNAMKVAADKTKKDPYEALIQVLDSSRYQAIEAAIKPLIA